MNNQNETVATEVLRLLKKEYNKAIKRLYILLIVIMCLFVFSVVDSIYQRCRIINIVKEYEENCIQEVAELKEE